MFFRHLVEEFCTALWNHAVDCVPRGFHMHITSEIALILYNCLWNICYLDCLKWRRNKKLSGTVFEETANWTWATLESKCCFIIPYCKTKSIFFVGMYVISDLPILQLTEINRQWNCNINIQSRRRCSQSLVDHFTKTEILIHTLKVETFSFWLSDEKTCCLNYKLQFTGITLAGTLLTSKSIPKTNYFSATTTLLNWVKIRNQDSKYSISSRRWCQYLR